MTKDMTPEDMPETMTDELISLGHAFDHFHSFAAGEAFREMLANPGSADLSFRHMHALFQLFRQGALPIAKLAEAVGLSPTAASRMVDGLVTHDYVAREENSADRRQKLVRLTQKGAAKLESLRDATVRAYAALLATIPAAQRAQLHRSLREAAIYLPHHPLGGDQR